MDAPKMLCSGGRDRLRFSLLDMSESGVSPIEPAATTWTWMLRGTCVFQVLLSLLLLFMRTSVSQPCWELWGWIDPETQEVPQAEEKAVMLPAAFGSEGAASE